MNQKIAAEVIWISFVDPILDQTFFFDAFHELRLKEEYDVQPWSFDQHPEEAIIVPTGCPYEIKKLKDQFCDILYWVCKCWPCFNIVADKKVAISGFSLKKDTGDNGETPPLTI